MQVLTTLNSVHLRQQLAVAGFGHFVATPMQAPRRDITLPSMAAPASLKTPSTLFCGGSGVMIKFNSPKPWAAALAVSVLVTFGSFSLIASSFQQVASDAARVAQLPPVTVVGKRAAVGHEFAGQSVQTTPVLAKL